MKDEKKTSPRYLFLFKDVLLVSKRNVKRDEYKLVFTVDLAHTTLSRTGSNSNTNQNQITSFIFIHWKFSLSSKPKKSNIFDDFDTETFLENILN